ncbi:MAG: type II toxin-antitoxin system Phd/YefM family antitoxin [Deltaproteobacteria bacterium]|nr:type II toxin-antitoxin system Phd/YefM family antitoxin [Deltaproteobacteria bacterium]
MKPVRMQDDIVPIDEFKTHASRIMRRLQEERRPIVITERGKATGVLVTPEDFDRLTERERFVTAVEQGLAESEAGLTISNEELTEHFERRFLVAQDK